MATIQCAVLKLRQKSIPFLQTNHVIARLNQSAVRSWTPRLPTSCHSQEMKAQQIPKMVAIGQPLTWQRALPRSVITGAPLVLGALIPVVLTTFLSTKLNLGLEKEIQVAVLRATLQLCTLGFCLKVVFEGRSIALTVVAMMVMVVVAGQTAGERAKKLPRSRLISTVALVCGAFGTILLMVLLRVLPIEPKFLIPGTGSVVGNSMSVVAMTLNGIHHEIQLHEEQIEAALALGATPEQAVNEHVRRSLIRGLGPIFDHMKVSGMVFLPGSMTGMLMSGSQPLEAVRTSLILLYMLVGAASLSSVIGAQLGWRSLFTESMQLVQTS